METIQNELDTFDWTSGPTTRSDSGHTEEVEKILDSWAILLLPLRPYLSTVHKTIKASLTRLETYAWDVEAPLLPQWQKQVSTTRGVFKTSAADPDEVHATLLQTLTQFEPVRGDAQAGATVRMWIRNTLGADATPLDLVLALAEIDDQCQQIHRKINKPAKPSGGGNNKASSSSKSRVNANSNYP